MKDESLNFQEFDSDFLKIINSLGFEDEEIALSKPLRMEAYKVRKGDTYSKLASGSININAEDQCDSLMETILTSLCLKAEQLR